MRAERDVTHAVSMPRQVVLWRQKAGRSPDGMVCWDYHCFALERDTRASSTTARVFDMDRCGRDLHPSPSATLALQNHVITSGQPLCGHHHKCMQYAVITKEIKAGRCTSLCACQ